MSALDQLEKKICNILCVYDAEDAAGDIMALIRSTNRRKLSEIEVVSLRKQFARGASLTQLAKRFEINPATVSRIVREIYHP